MRERFNGDLADSLRGAVLIDITNAINTLDHLLHYEHPAAVIRNLLGGHKELVKARASIGLAAVAAEQQESTNG